ncbi:hypothetical protein BK125_20830 [Paenibacillus odorifer]|uniref:DUF2513 domain-containing protein n=1 Tax=Paenibacillus odorifer TaxID=189426 RepID=A0ABX3GG81_9BACL|nr:DUF2513 domain-containing protein [Paenibacillus odorifer]OMC74248.1 hypothetical protein BK125_20830 [Paenibacillus odorifer]OMD14808.1 hypothetical protein BSO21_27675 [Paenibacillus odorifer]
MKRDMDLVIKVLKYIEENNTATNNIVVEIEGYEGEEERELVQYQVKLLRDAGYIEAKGVLNPFEFYVRNMTWEGHEFLDAARNEVIVNEAKEVAKKKGLDFLSLPFELTKALLVEVTKRTLLG